MPAAIPAMATSHVCCELLPYEPTAMPKNETDVLAQGKNAPKNTSNTPMAPNRLSLVYITSSKLSQSALGE
jgi:hypothetical protein